jgi:diguanylate cyclase (GGDEF)-like protein
MSEDLRQGSLEIEQAQLRGFARSIAGVEWLLLLLVILYVFVAGPPASNQLTLLGAIAGFAGLLLLLRVVPRLRGKTHRKLSIEIVAMVGFLTLVLSQIGGDSSPLLNLYLLPITAAAVVLGIRSAALISVLVAGCYFLLATAEVGADAFSPAYLTQAAAVLVPFALVAALTGLLAEDIETAKRRIRALSDRDSLTDLLNMRAFMRIAARDHRNAARRSRPYAVLLVDIDHLRNINETYGHDSGNKALRTVAGALLRVTSADDLVARLGGEEFVVYLADKDEEAAAEVAQRLRNLVYSSTLEVNVEIVRIQVSVGSATFPADGDTLERVMSAAERAMYEDKKLRKQPDGQLVIQKR